MSHPRTHGKAGETWAVTQDGRTAHWLILPEGEELTLAGELGYNTDEPLAVVTLLYDRGLHYRVVYDRRQDDDKLHYLEYLSCFIFDLDKPGTWERVKT